jgi:hypothetical protein
VTRFDEQAFDALRRDADVVATVRQRATELLAMHQATAFDGLGDMLQRVLPGDPEQLTRVARIFRFTSDQLEGLRQGDLDPGALPPEPLVALGQVLGLELHSFLTLVARDHQRFGGAQWGLNSRAPARGSALNQGEMGSLKAAWNRAALDLPEGS